MGVKCNGSSAPMPDGVTTAGGLRCKPEEDDEALAWPSMLAKTILQEKTSYPLALSLRSKTNQKNSMSL